MSDFINYLQIIKPVHRQATTELIRLIEGRDNDAFKILEYMFENWLNKSVVLNKRSHVLYRALRMILCTVNYEKYKSSSPILDENTPPNSIFKCMNQLFYEITVNNNVDVLYIMPFSLDARSTALYLDKYGVKIPDMNVYGLVKLVNRGSSTIINSMRTFSTLTFSKNVTVMRAFGEIVSYKERGAPLGEYIKEVDTVRFLDNRLVKNDSITYIYSPFTQMFDVYIETMYSNAVVFSVIYSRINSVLRFYNNKIISPHNIEGKTVIILNVQLALEEAWHKTSIILEKHGKTWKACTIETANDEQLVEIEEIEIQRLLNKVDFKITQWEVLKLHEQINIPGVYTGTCYILNTMIIDYILYLNDLNNKEQQVTDIIRRLKNLTDKTIDYYYCYVLSSLKNCYVMSGGSRVVLYKYINDNSATDGVLNYYLIDKTVYIVKDGVEEVTGSLFSALVS